MNRQLYATKTVTDADRTFALDYYIVEDEMPLSDSMGILTYGIEIVKRSQTQVEAARASLLFSAADAAENFAEVLLANLVFPVSLAGIVEDMLAGQEIPHFVNAPSACCLVSETKIA